jgi:beta-lactamase class A
MAMKSWRGSVRVAAALVLGSAAVPFLAPAASASTAASAACGSSSHPALAAKLSRDIQAAQRGRSSAVAVGVDDPSTGVTCWLNGSQHFDSASVVKVTILGALLRKAQDQHRYLTSHEAALATAMITKSDNNAASALWADVGRSHLQHFLDLAQMKQTALGPGGYWGLTQITAHNEVVLLRLLLHPNQVLSTASRNYALNLMAHVISSQRWGVPAGAPASLTVHVKNGWLPRPTHGWRIHSIGCFTGRGGGYSIAVLTENNPNMAYGVTTVQAIARVINRDLNPGTTAATPSSVPVPSSQTPDETIPALPNIP